jgi:hypothetical protein
MSSQAGLDQASPRPFQRGIDLIQQLLGILDGRIGNLLDTFHHRLETQDDLGLRGLVITAVEASGLLSPPSERTPEYAPGSLWAAVEPRVAESRRNSTALALEVLRERFRLSPFEIECVLVCLAPDVSSKYQKLFAYLNDDITRKFATIQLLLLLLGNNQDAPALRRMLLPTAPLLRSGVLEFIEDQPPASQLGRCLRVEAGVAQFLLDDFHGSAELHRVWLDSEWPALAEETWNDSAAAELEAVLRGYFEPAGLKRDRLAIALSGRPGCGKRHAAEKACARLGLGLFPLDCRRLLRDRQPGQVIARAFRDSLLHAGLIFLGHFDAVLEDRDRGPEIRLELERNIEQHGWIVAVSLENPVPLTGMFARHNFVHIPVAEPTAGGRLELWRKLLSDRAGMSEKEAGPVAAKLASKFRLTGGQMAVVFQRAAQSLSAESRPAAWSAELHRQAAASSAPRLGELAQRIVPLYRWKHLVLPQRQTDLVHDIARHIQYRRKVMETWRFETLRSRGKGLAVLFSGQPGTGKTMAAEVVANELQMDIYRIDLSAVVSKYIGETEKNLSRIFREAEHSDVILFFDEADALFGKRSEVKDAHDRYANIEINYLLQQIETYEGLAILATNMRQHLDEAFLRRMQVVVEFPMPGYEDRLRIWRQSFPPDAPLDSDIDFAFLARAFDLAGGNISNVALGAALLGAERRDRIGMEEIVQATRREMEKIGKRAAPDEFGAYAALLNGTAAPALAV